MKVGDKVMRKSTKDVYTISEIGRFICGDPWISLVELPNIAFNPEHYEIIAPQDASRSARHNIGKTQVREVDPAFVMGLGEVLTASRQKYDEGNWMKETKLSTPYESAMRHLMKFWSGEDMDDETKLSHLLHCATNIMFLHYHMSSGKGIDDRLFKKDKK